MREPTFVSSTLHRSTTYAAPAPIMPVKHCATYEERRPSDMVPARQVAPLHRDERYTFRAPTYGRELLPDTGRMPKRAEEAAATPCTETDAQELAPQEAPLTTQTLAKVTPASYAAAMPSTPEITEEEHQSLRDLWKHNVRWQQHFFHGLKKHRRHVR